MFFGVWNSARANKENILYAIVTVFLLERVRTGWNRVESRGRKAGLGTEQIKKRQNRLMVCASLLYALPMVLPVIKYIYRSVEELAWSVPGLLVLKNTWAFWGLLVLTECFLALIIYNLLRIYVDRLNAAVGFFKAIGRNVRDGSLAAVHAGGSVGMRALAGARKLATDTRALAGAKKLLMTTRVLTAARETGECTRVSVGARKLVVGARELTSTGARMVKGLRQWTCGAVASGMRFRSRTVTGADRLEGSHS